MTNLIIDLTDVLDEYHDDDAVVVWPPHHREGSRGQVVSTAKKRIRLTAGKAEREVEPGPLMVQVQCLGISDTATKDCVVPDQASVTLRQLLEQGFTYTPPVVTAVQQARNQTMEYMERAEAGADRVGSAERVIQAEETAVDAAAEAVAASMVSGRRRVDMENPTPAEIDAVLDTMPAGSTVMNLSTGEVWGQ